MAATTEELRYGGALVVILLGMIVIAVLALMLPVGPGKWEPSDVIALVGALTTFLGTVIGAFLGVQVGAANRDKAERLANRALSALPPETAAQVMSSEAKN